jgi:hypothetical protein
VNRAIAEWGCEGIVDQAVLLEQRQAVEARARDRDLEVVAAAGSILHVNLRARKRLFEQASEAVNRHLGPGVSALMGQELEQV